MDRTTKIVSQANRHQLHSKQERQPGLYGTVSKQEEGALDKEKET